MCLLIINTFETIRITLNNDLLPLRIILNIVHKTKFKSIYSISTRIHLLLEYIQGYEYSLTTLQITSTELYDGRKIRWQQILVARKLYAKQEFKLYFYNLEQNILHARIRLSALRTKLNVCRPGRSEEEKSQNNIFVESINTSAKQLCKFKQRLTIISLAHSCFL